MTGETIEITPNVPGVVRWVEAGLVESDPTTARRVMLAATDSDVPAEVAGAVSRALCCGLSDRADVFAWRLVAGRGPCSYAYGVALVRRSGGPGGGPGLAFSTHEVVLPDDGRPAYLLSGVYDLSLGDAFADWCDRAGVIL